MTLAARDPNTIWLGGPKVEENTYVAGEAITPGHLIELYNDGGTLKWRKNASATEIQAIAVALDQPELNKGVDDAYAAGDLVRAAFFAPGSKFWGLIASGQDIDPAELLKSAADGTLQTVGTSTADANLGHFQSLEDTGAVTALTRVRVQVIN